MRPGNISIPRVSGAATKHSWHMLKRGALRKHLPTPTEFISEYWWIQKRIVLSNRVRKISARRSGYLQHTNKLENVGMS
jgi:hypothetical protein